MAGACQTHPPPYDSHGSERIGMKAAWLVMGFILGAPPARAAGPETVTGFSLPDLDRRAATESSDLWAFVPNAHATLAPGLGSAVEPTLRGLGGGEGLTGRTPAVGTIVDGVALPSVVGSRFGFFDVDRLEVVRGPQGVAGGAQFEGGALRVQMARPADENAGYLETGFGNRDRWTLRGSIDIPLHPALALKFSGFRSDGRGYVKNDTTGDYLNDSDMAGVRAAAELRPTDRLRWNVAVAGIQSDGENLWNAACDSDCSSRHASTGMPADRAEGGAPQYPGLAISGRKGAEPLGNRTRTLLVTSNLSYAGAAHGLELITGYVRATGRYALDFADGRPLAPPGMPMPAPRGWPDGGAVLAGDTAQDQFSQEVRLSGRFGWLGYRIGGYYAEGDARRDEADWMTAEPAATPLLLADRVIRTHREVKAGYGQLAAQWGAVTVTGGVRYTDESLRLDLADNRPGCAPGFCLDAIALGNAGVPARLSAQRWTPQAAIEWQADPGLLLFASARRGYRAGEWNVRALDASTFQPTATEAGWTYEAGLRGQWLDGRLRAGLTGFVIRMDDAQVSWSVLDAEQNRLLTAVGNVGQLRNEGVELELAASPWQGLDLSAAAGWQNARYTANAAMLAAAAQCRADGAGGAACGRGIVTAEGRIADPAGAPDFSATLGGSWAIRWTSGESFITPAAYLTYRSDMVLDPADTRRPGSSWMVQASLALSTDDGLWMLAAECSNCLDTDKPTTNWAGLSYPAAPRTWLIKARRRF
jgi:iron complex outermembrane receptor protein